MPPNPKLRSLVPFRSKGAIKYEQDELAACKSLVDQCLSDDPDTIISYASISFKEQGMGESVCCNRDPQGHLVEPVGSRL